jgi:outer membrane lipopolysaccharide assembly protein LptE/RlpB
MSLLARLSYLFIFLLLTGCGFQLRDTIMVAGLGQMYVQDQVDIHQINDKPVSTRLALDLATITEQEVLNIPKTGAMGIVIVREEVIENSYSLSTSLLNRQVEVEKRVDYEIIDETGQIMFSNSFSASQLLTTSQSNPRARQQEKQRVIDYLNASLSRRLVYKLDSLLRESLSRSVAVQ